ncbi:MAG: hypothetical protein Q9208_001216 [Pyrenodesmia sp. 3 TL-2023]
MDFPGLEKAEHHGHKLQPSRDCQPGKVHLNAEYSSTEQAAHNSGPSVRQESDTVQNAPGSSRLAVVQILKDLLRYAEESSANVDTLADPLHSEKDAVLGSRDPESGAQQESASTSLSGAIGIDPTATTAIAHLVGGSPPSAFNAGFRHRNELLIGTSAPGSPDDPCQPFAACSHGPTQKVRIMSEEEMASENDARSSSRPKWTIRRGAELLLNCWTILWQQRSGAGKGLCKWKIDDNDRRNLQLKLVDALLSGQPDDYLDEHIRDDIRAIVCWVALIGLRLNDLYCSMTVIQTDILPNDVNPIPPMAQVEVLIECLWACNVCKHAQVGKVLEMCYKRRVLTQPNFDDPPPYVGSRLILQIHVFAVRIALYLVSILFKHALPEVIISEDLDKIWITTLSTLEVDMRQDAPKAAFDVGSRPFFAIDDLNLRDLQKFGHLQIRWTYNWDEHLRLQINDQSRLLHLYWFQPGLSLFFTET